MPTSFEALHNETRPLALLAETEPPRCTPWPSGLLAAGVGLAGLLLLL